MRGLQRCEFAPTSSYQPLIGLHPSLQAIADEYASAKSADIPGLAARAAALTQLSRFAPEVFDKHSTVYMAFLLKKLLMVPQPLHPAGGEANSDVDMDAEEEWYENDDDVPELLRAKVQALKVCRYRCLANRESERAVEVAAPVMKMLATLLEQGGRLRVAKEGEEEELEEYVRLLWRLEGMSADGML